MKRKITIKKLEEGEGATLYVFTLENESGTEIKDESCFGIKAESEVEIKAKSETVTKAEAKIEPKAESEYEKFWNKYEPNIKLSWEFDLIDNWIEKFLKTGCEFEEFKIVTGNTKALPIEVGSKLRLYCYRISKGILILGNGGIKLRNPDPKKNRIKDFPELFYYCETVKAVGLEIEEQLKQPIKAGKIGIIDNELQRLEQNPIYINIPDEPKP